MSGGYRCIVIAAVGWLTLAGASPPQKGAPNRAPEQQQSQADKAGEPAASKPYHPYPDKLAESCYQASDHDTADLCAQWRAAIAAEKAAEAAASANWIGGAGALLSFISIVLVCIALGQTRRANRLAEDTARRQLRAYVCFGHVETPDSPGGEFVVQIEWRNNGQTPASNAVAFVDWRDMPEGMPDDFDFPAPSEKPRIGRGTIGPGSEVFVACDRKLPNWILQKAASGDAKVYLWSAIDYVDAFGAMRRTEFAGILVVEELMGGQLGMEFTCIAKHNGIDGECLKQPYADCPSHLRPDPTHHEQ